MSRSKARTLAALLAQAATEEQNTVVSVDKIADAVSISGAETLTNKIIQGLKEVRVNLVGSTIDLSAGNAFSKTIITATTFSFSNVPAAGVATSAVLDITNGGAYTVTWPNSIDWAGGSPPALTASGRDVLGFFTHDGGTTWTGFLMGKDVS